MSGREFHGWSRQVGPVPGEQVQVGPAVHIGPLPGRKSICLYTVTDGTIRTHAFFRSEEDARAALDAIDNVMGWPAPPAEEVPGE